MKQFKLFNKIFLFSISVLAITIGVLLFLNNKDVELSNVVTHKLSTTAKLASEVAVDNTDGYKALAAGIGIGLAALGGTIAMGLANIPLNIDWQQILLHLLNFVILVGGLYLLLYNPIKKFIAKRKEYYKNIDNEAKNNMEKANAKEAEINERLASLEKEIEEKRQQATKEIEEYKKNQIEETNKQTLAMLENAKDRAMKDKEKILADANKEIKQLVTQATKKVVSSSTSDAYKDFLDGAIGSDTDATKQ